MGCFESVVEKPKSFRKRGKFYAVAISELSERSSFVRNCEGDIKDYYDFQDSLDGVHVFLVVDKRTQFLRAVKKVDKE